MVVAVIARFPVRVALNHASGMKRSITAAGRGQQRTTVGKASRPASLVRADGASQLTTAQSEQ